MTDPRFFAQVGPLTLGDQAERTGAEIAAGADLNRRLDDVAPLEVAEPRHVNFLDNRKYVDTSARNRAGAVFVHPGGRHGRRAPWRCCSAAGPTRPTPLRRRDSTRRRPCGAGYRRGPQSIPAPASARVARLAPTSSSTAAPDPDTAIGDGTMIDNLVQIGHNVVIDDIVTIGGQGGLAGHLTLGKGARVAAHSGVLRDIAPSETVCGFPALPSKEFWRGVSLLRRLARKKGR